MSLNGDGGNKSKMIRIIKVTLRIERVRTAMIAAVTMITLAM